MIGELALSIGRLLSQVPSVVAKRCIPASAQRTRPSRTCSDESAANAAVPVPTTSRSFSMKNASVESLKLSVRWGLRPKSSK